MGKVPDTPGNMARCICGGCAIFKDYELAGGYYCAAGIAEEE